MKIKYNYSMNTKTLYKSKMTSLQIPLNQSDKETAELVTQEILGLSLGSTIKMIVKIIAQKKEIPLNINLSQEFDETKWLLNNPAFGQRLLDSIEKVNKVIELNDLDSINYLNGKNNSGNNPILQTLNNTKEFVVFNNVEDFEKQTLNN
jgi:antitoxin component of RelBE/YafQ-DinJ toxin-antitoxin module